MWQSISILGEFVFYFNLFLHEPTQTPRGNRTTSFDLVIPSKKLKKSPTDIAAIPDTPRKEDALYQARHPPSTSRLNNDFRIVDVIGASCDRLRRGVFCQSVNSAVIGQCVSL